MALLPVKYFTSAMQGAPQLTNAWGDLVSVLDACLVNGFNLKPVASITSAAGIATVTIAAGHLYQVDQVLAHAGADQAEYNGEFRVLTANATQYTIAITGTPVSPATGASISTKVAPLNFQKVFSGTNKGVYRSTNVLSNRPYLRVDNSLDPVWTTTYAKKGKVTMAEAMTDVDTFVANAGRAPFLGSDPTKNEVGTGAGATAIDGWFKWYYARQGSNTTDTDPPEAFNRFWVLVGDDRGFYLINQHGSNSGRSMYFFTDFSSFRQADGYSSILGATEFGGYSAQSSNPSNVDSDGYYSAGFANRANLTNSPVGKACMRNHTQVGNYIRLSFASLGTIAGPSVSGYSTGVPWPNGPDYSLVLHPVYLQEETAGHLRGKMPGLMWVHNNSPMSDMAVVANVTGYPGQKFLLVDTAYGFSGNSVGTARMAFNITGPWY